MLSGISVICFGASYAVVLLLEISRLFVRVSVRTAVMIGFAAAGFLAHTIFILQQFRAANADGLPLITWYTGCLVVAWVLVAVYLVLFLISRRTAAGLLLLPTSVTMVVVAHLFPSTPRARQIWNLFHGISLAMGMALVVIGFVAGLMYLHQSRRLKLKLPPRRNLWIPSLERLETLNERCLLASVGLWGLGLMSGIVLNLHHTGSEVGVPWSDPVVIASLVWLAWLIVVVAFHTLYRPARQGRKVAYMTIGSFVFLTLVLSIIYLMPSSHVTASQLHVPLVALPWGVRT